MPCPGWDKRVILWLRPMYLILVKFVSWVLIYFSDLPSLLDTNSMDAFLHLLKEDVPACPQTSDRQNTTPSLYDELFLPTPSQKCPVTPQLDIDHIDEFIQKELDVISSELTNYINIRRGQKVKRRLFSGTCSDDEPIPKKRRTSASYSYEDTDSDFTWTTSVRLS